MEELKFGTTQEALQHLSNLTGSQIKIAGDSKLKIDTKVAVGEFVSALNAAKSALSKGMLPLMTTRVQDSADVGKAMGEVTDGIEILKKKANDLRAAIDRNA